MINRLIVAILCGVLAGTESAHAGNLTDWVQAAAAVLLHHEAGHYNVGNGLVSDTSPAINDKTKLWIGSPTNGSASTGFAMTGNYGLGYTIDVRNQPTAPNAAVYPGAVNRDGVIYMPQQSYNLWQADQAKYDQALSFWWKGVARAEGATAGAGFAAQQAAIERSNLPLPVYKKALILSGVFQAGYVAYHYASVGNTGDITRMRIAAPESLVVGALLISAASDMFRGDQETPSRYRIGFLSDVRTGAVGLNFSGIF